MNNMFTEKDIEHIERKGLTLDDVYAQIELFKNGVPFVNLTASATVNNGIIKCSKIEKDDFINYFDTQRNTINIAKFVPASGAATRMFKTLFKFVEEFDPEEDTINAFINKHKVSDLQLFLLGIEKLPFYNQVNQRLNELYPHLDTFSHDKHKWLFAKMMLDKKHLNYGYFPKGLLPFHKYKSHLATAFQEHLFEAALYAASDYTSFLHFTISERYHDMFDAEFKRIQEIVEQKTNTKFHLTFSYQKESTDTIAVTPDNKPFRDKKDSLIFRPSGHGALLHNLNEVNADLIFIKNIDNVVVYTFEQDIAEHKKILAGMLLKIQHKVFDYLNMLDEKEIADEMIEEISGYLVDTLHIKLSKEFYKYSKPNQIQYLREKLNRPIRVCGMVKNEGEPGGGPFWVKDDMGQVSLQIVESAQIDKKNKRQKEILLSATHFNPVDLVCGIKDYKGELFDLQQFVDPSTAFITLKSKEGKELQALELPGLWNGSMAGWTTVFVEVPLITFNPVKTVMDLVKPAHQIKN